jgi:hypothetical protein
MDSKVWFRVYPAKYFHFIVYNRVLDTGPQVPVYETFFQIRIRNLRLWFRILIHRKIRNFYDYRYSHYVKVKPSFLRTVPGMFENGIKRNLKSFFRTVLRIRTIIGRIRIRLPILTLINFRPTFFRNFFCENML